MTIDELRQLQQQTWDVLNSYNIDPNDVRSVNRWDKLSRLFVWLDRQIKKELNAEPTEEMFV